MNTITKIEKSLIWISFTFLMLFGISYSAGWHTAEEILSGEFKGKYTFKDEVNFSNQVAFMAMKTAHQDSVDGEIITFDDIKINKGGGYSTSTNKFKAPISGVYFLYFDGITQDKASSGNLRFYKNGANTDITIHGNTGSDGHEKVYGSIIINLVKGDTISIHSEGTQYIYGGGEHTRFAGFLIR